MSDLVPLTALAVEASMHPYSIKKSLVRAGYAPRAVRIKGRKCYALSRSDADRFIAERNTDGVVEAGPIEDGLGGIYLVRPDPEFRPNRLKLGRAVSFDNRLRGHRCIAPEMEVLALWSTQSQWMESMALGILSNQAGVKFASAEVFDVDDVGEVTQVLEAAFGMQGVKNLRTGE